MNLTVGLPQMHLEACEKRAFLPDFVADLAQSGFTVYLEDGYSAGMGFTNDDYRAAFHDITFYDLHHAYQQGIVMVLRYPGDEPVTRMRRGVCLMSMLHYPPRLLRVAFLRLHGLQAILFNSIKDDVGRRLIENMRALAWKGIEAAFDILECTFPGLVRPAHDPIRVLILGTGMVDKNAIKTAPKLGNVERTARNIEVCGAGSIAWSVGRNLSGDSARMGPLLRQADILMDATQRRDPSQPVVPNDWFAWLPGYAVVVDLAVDPSLLNADPPTVRGIEDIPQGNLDICVIDPADMAWDHSVPTAVPSHHRRTTVTCYSWLDIDPEACMEHYARQIRPLMEKGYRDISQEGGYYWRALCREKVSQG